MDDSYRSLGGYTFTISINQTTTDFLDQIGSLKNDEKLFVSNTVSVVADVVFYNKVTHSLVYAALRAQRRPSGLINYEFEFHKPIG